MSRAYNVMLHDWRFFDKESLTKWSSGIKVTILDYPKEVTVPELAEALTSGHPVILGHLEYEEEDHIQLRKGKRVGASSRHWKKQQVFAVDIDNSLKKQPDLDDRYYVTVDKALTLCKERGVMPAFIYTTYSHKDDWHKFRVVFVLDREITSLEEREQVMKCLLEVFTIDGKLLADPKCIDAARLFFPGKEIVYKDYEQIVNTRKLLRIKPTYETTAESFGIHKEKASPKPANEIIELLKRKEFEEVKKRKTNLLSPPENPDAERVSEGSAGGRTIIFDYNIIKDYCSPFSSEASKPVFIRHPEDYYELVSHLPIHELLDLPFGKHFRCILPGHEDKNASAMITRRRGSGEYIYQCFGCLGNQFYDFFNLLEALTGWSHQEAKEFVNFLLDVEFETEWQKEKKKEINDFQDYLRSEQFKKNYPNLYAELKKANALGLLDFLLGEAKRLIYDRTMTKKDKPIFFVSISQLSVKMKDYGFTGTAKSSLQRKIKFLMKLGLIEQIADEELPKEFIFESHRRRKQKGYRYRVNYFAVPDFSLTLFARAEQELIRYKEKYMRRKFYNSQMEVWANGEKEAKEQYVQEKEIKKSKETLKFYEKYKAVALGYLEKQGYTTEKQILGHPRMRAVKRKKELSAIVLPQLLQEYKLSIVNFNKHYKEKFNIRQADLHYGSSKIIIRKEDVL